MPRFSSSGAFRPAGVRPSGSGPPSLSGVMVKNDDDRVFRPLRVRSIVLVLLAIVALVGLVVFMQYRHQVISYVTHPKGSPTHTEPFVPYAPGEQPDLHV